VAEILVKFDEPIAAPSGRAYFAQAVGKEIEGGLWEGWLEFQAVYGEFDALASGRETTQPNRKNLEYWAQGLSKVYLEGALDRAISLAEPPRESRPIEDEPSLFTGPADRGAPPTPAAAAASATPRPILDPFQVYAQGEEILRRELNALSRDHIESIAMAYRIGASTAAGISATSRADLIDAIVGAAQGDQVRGTPDSGAARADL
jgi:hypothetical protein